MTKHSETHMFPSADFKEIYIKVTRETLYRRDQKGLYTIGRKEVVGVDLPYDGPVIIYIVQCKQYGSAIVVTPCNTVVLRRGEGEGSGKVVPRDQLAMTQTPQAFPIKKLADALRWALEQGITGSIASCTLMIELGEEVHFSIGAETNIELTTPDDLKIFKALLAIREHGE